MIITTYFKGGTVSTVIAGLFITLSYYNAFWAAASYEDSIGKSYQLGLWTACFDGNCASMARSDNPGQILMPVQIFYQFLII